MKLTYAQIQSITVGAAYTEEADDGIYFHKCTERQESAWLALNETLGARAKTTTGIRLDFHTDSSHLELAAHGSDSFELHINGLFVNYLPMQKLSVANGSVKLDLRSYQSPETGECRVTVIFPSHTVGVLDALFLDDGASLRRHSFDTKLLFIGDSITQGACSGQDSLSYAWRVTRMLNAESIIHGIGGGYFHESVFDTVDFDPDTVILAFGTNDFSHYATYEELREHARAFLSLTVKEYGGKQIFAVSPTWRGKNREKAMGTFDGARRVLIEEIERAGICHVDGMRMVPHLPEFFGDEWIHPNANGYSLYAENLLRAMGRIR